MLCTCCMQYNEQQEELYTGNITHNLSTMAIECGLYNALWGPEDIGAIYAKNIINIVKRGLEKLKADPEHYKKFSPANGWGRYESFVCFVEDYLEALETHPDAEIVVSC